MSLGRFNNQIFFVARGETSVCRKFKDDLSMHLLGLMWWWHMNSFLQVYSKPTQVFDRGCSAVMQCFSLARVHLRFAQWKHKRAWIPQVTLKSRNLEVLNWVHLPSLPRGAFFDCTEWSRDPVSNGSCNETTSWKPMEFLEARLLLGYDRKLKIVYVVSSFTEPTYPMKCHHKKDVPSW